MYYFFINIIIINFFKDIMILEYNLYIFIFIFTYKLPLNKKINSFKIRLLKFFFVSNYYNLEIF